MVRDSSSMFYEYLKLGGNGDHFVLFLYVCSIWHMMSGCIVKNAVQLIVSQRLGHPFLKTNASSSRYSDLRVQSPPLELS